MAEHEEFWIQPDPSDKFGIPYWVKKKPCEHKHRVATPDKFSCADCGKVFRDASWLDFPRCETKPRRVDEQALSKMFEAEADRVREYREKKGLPELEYQTKKGGEGPCPVSGASHRWYATGTKGVLECKPCGLVFDFINFVDKTPVEPRIDIRHPSQCKDHVWNPYSDDGCVYCGMSMKDWHKEYMKETASRCRVHIFKDGICVDCGTGYEEYLKTECHFTITKETAMSSEWKVFEAVVLTRGNDEGEGEDAAPQILAQVVRLIVAKNEAQARVMLGQDLAGVNLDKAEVLIRPFCGG